MTIINVSSIRRAGLAALVTFLAFPALAGEVPSKEIPSKPSIYERLGGRPAIEAAVDLFYEKILGDDRVNHFFEDVSMKRQIKRQKAFLAAAFGGPVPYEGRDLRRAHKHLDLTDEDFGVIAGHLNATLVELKVGEELVAEVMALVATTKDAVLNRQPKTEAGKE